MRLALAEARKGLGKTSPNPAVGAVVVRNGVLLGKGWHRRAGKPHAEIEALRSLPKGVSAQGATLYVTLEPCSTHGRTPPCVEAILQAGFARVVVGTTDPNPAHVGKGLEILRQAGVVVTENVLENDCRDLNEAFNHWITTGRPLVIAKSAMSLDGRISRPPGESPWLTSAAARRLGHRLRAQVDAILVGAGTVRTDNPRLTVRGHGKRAAGRQPWRIVLSRSGDLPRDAAVFTDEWKERTLVFSDLNEALHDLGRRQATSVLIEGGGELIGSALDRGLVDRIFFFYAPILVGGNVSATGGEGVGASAEAWLLEKVTYEKIGPDLLCKARVSPKNR